MALARHDERDCTCVQYKLDFTVYDLRYAKNSRYCKACGRHVSLDKWKGGIIKFGNRSRVVSQEFCPCCGERLRSGRRAKARLLSSITDQQKNPDKYNEIVIKKLDKKIKYMQSLQLLPITK